MINRILLLLLIVCVCISPLQAEQSLNGFIRDDETGEPLPYANVILPDLERGAVSRSDGYFVLSDVPIGTHQLIVSIIGYKTHSTSLSMVDGLDMRLDIRLSPSILEGQSIEVSAEREKFKELVSTSTVTLDRRAIEVAPAFVEADVFRALQLLPGVQSLNDFSSALYVRGSTPDQNLIMLDGITVYNPMHLAGIFSTFNTDAIKEADFHAGGFEARYGGRLGSILNIVNREGNTEKVSGNANISLISSKILLEGPLPKFENDRIKGSWMLAGRRTYFDVVVNGFWNTLVKPNLDEWEREHSPNKIAPYYFYDFQGKLNLDVGTDHRLTWSSFYGDDVLDWDLRDEYSSDDDYWGYEANSDYYSKSEQKTIFDWRWGNFTNSLTWRWIINPSLIARTSIANSRFRFEVNIDSDYKDYYRFDGDTTESREIFWFDLFDRINDESIETELTWLPSEDHTVTAGFQNKRVGFHLGMIIGADYEQHSSYEDYSESLIDTLMWMRSKPVEAALYIQDRWQISPLLSTQLGLRAASYSLHDTTYLEPRFGAKLLLSDQISLKASLGRYHQFLTVANPPDENLRFLDIWFGIPEDKPAPRSDHFIMGLEYLSQQDYLFRAEAYYKDFDHLLTLKPTSLIAIDEDGTVRVDPFNEFWDTDAYATGVELLFKKLTGKVRGWAGYTYAITERKYEGQDWYFPKYDRTHTLNAVADWALTQKLHFSTAVTYSTGNPYTAVNGRSETFEQNTWGLENSYWLNQNFLYGERHGERYPAYFRLDLSLKSRKPWMRGTREWYIQVLNATNHLNVFTYLYDNRGEFNPRTGAYENKGVQRLGIPMFPFFPTFGVKYEF